MYLPRFANFEKICAHTDGTLENGRKLDGCATHAHTPWTDPPGKFFNEERVGTMTDMFHPMNWKFLSDIVVTQALVRNAGQFSFSVKRASSRTGKQSGGAGARREIIYKMEGTEKTKIQILREKRSKILSTWRNAIPGSRSSVRDNGIIRHSRSK